MEQVKRKKEMTPEAKQRANEKRRKTMEKKKEMEKKYYELPVDDTFPDPRIAKPEPKKVPLLDNAGPLPSVTVNCDDRSLDEDEGSELDIEADLRTCLPDPETSKVKVFQSDFTELCNIKTMKQPEVRKLFKRSLKLQSSLKKPLHSMVNKIVDDFSKKIKESLYAYADAEFDKLNEELQLKHIVNDQWRDRLSKRDLMNKEERDFILGIYTTTTYRVTAPVDALNVQFELFKSQLDQVKDEAHKQVFDQVSQLERSDKVIKKSRHVQGNNFYNMYLSMKTKHRDNTLALFRDPVIIDHIHQNPEIYGDYEEKFIQFLKLKPLEEIGTRLCSPPKEPYSEEEAHPPTPKGLDDGDDRPPSMEEEEEYEEEYEEELEEGECDESSE